MLDQFRSIITSQNGEDGVIQKTFEIIGPANKWCVEFGAGSGKKGNNTWNLIRHQGWSAVLIEGDRALYQKLVQNYADLPGVHCRQAYVVAVGKNSLDALLASTSIPRDFDFLSIDIDGFDYYVWEALANYRPRAVMIEFNPGMPLDVDFVQPKNYPVGAGSSLAAIADLARSKGYELVYAYACNALFVLAEFYGRFGISDNTPDKILANPRPVKRFFELSDGSIVLLDSDPKRLLAARKKIAVAPVWVWAGGELRPVNFRRDNKLVRTVKSLIKRSFIYPLIYPLVMKFYGRDDRRRKKGL